jgi:hypothetical protein
MSSVVEEFKGNKILKLDMGNDRYFSFGVKKAETILNHIKDIEDFVKEFGSKQTKED